MAEKIVNIAKNTSYYTLALVIQKVISFSYFVIIARALGPEDLGKYYFALSFVTIFGVFTDLGLSNVLTRETAKGQADANILANNVFALKIPLSIFSWLAVVVLINLLGYPLLTKQLVYLASACMVLDSFTASFFATARGFHNLKFESISSVIFQLIVLTAGLATLRLGWGIRPLMGALVAASVFNFFYSLSALIFKWKISLRLKIDREFLTTIVKIALPFAIFGILQRTYTYLDSVLLSSISGDRAVGIYQVAFKIIFALQFLPMAFSASLYPAFASYWVNNREQLAITFERAMNYLLIISLPISIGIIAIADKVALLFRAGYEDSILPLRLNIVALVFIFLNFGVGALLNACDRQKINTVIMGIGTVASIILNLILIPQLAAVGASITVAVTNALMFAISIAVVPRILTYDRLKILKMCAKVFAAAVVMGVTASYLKSHFNVFLVVGFSGLIYFVLLFIFRAFTKEDVLSIIASFKNKGAEQKLEEIETI